jgi:hypothetical protein
MTDYSTIGIMNTQPDQTNGLAPTNHVARPATGPAIVSVAAIHRPKIPLNVQVAFDTDITASSLTYASGIPATQSQILHALENRFGRLEVWHLVHGDLDYGQEPAFITQRGTVNEAIADLAKIQFQGGGDLPENHLDGIDHLVRNVPWAMDYRTSRGALISFCTSDTKPSRSGLSAQALGEAIRQRRLLFYLVAEPFPWGYDLVEAAQGLFLPITNQPEPRLLKAISAALSTSLVGTVAAGKTVPMTFPSGSST